MHPREACATMAEMTPSLQVDLVLSDAITCSTGVVILCMVMQRCG